MGPYFIMGLILVGSVTKSKWGLTTNFAIHTCVVKFPPIIVKPMCDLMPDDGSHPSVVDVERQFGVEHVAL